MKRLKIDKSVVKWLLKAAGTVKGSLIFLFAVKILQGIMGIIFAFFLRSVIDAAVAKDWDTFTRSIFFGCGIVACEIALYWLAYYFKEKPAAELSKNLRSRVFSVLLNRSYADVSKVHTGEWMIRITSDTQVIANAITALIPGTAGLIVQLVCAFGAMFIVLPKLAWILIPIGAGMITVSLFMRLKIKNFHKAVQEYDGQSYSFIQESLGSMSILRTFTREEYSVKEAGDKLDKVVGARLNRARFIATCSSIVYALIRLSYFLGVAVCGIRLFEGVITYGMMAAVLQLIRQADLPLAEVTSAVPQFFNMIASAERLIEIEKLEPDYNDEFVSSEAAREYYDHKLSSIGFEKVSFSYDEDNREMVLNRFDLEIEKGSYIAFTGESGCGKSTTMNLLMGMYKPDEGTLYIKDTNGRREELNAGWRALFAYVPQENLLMSGRIRDVVAFSDPDRNYDDDTIWTALKIACAESFVRTLPSGLDTELGERGAGLSEGQMQRIAIARAVFSGRPILMLDESTSALDERTERQVLDNLKAMTDVTVVIITHRPAALQICNKIVEFKR